MANVAADNLRQLYAKSKIYWHAAGFGEDLDKHPERAEHFGIAIVEAMAAGCVPVVFAGGGPKEIITDQQDGILWTSTEQLQSETEELISDRRRLAKLSQSAILKSRQFSKDRFSSFVNNLINNK